MTNSVICKNILKIILNLWFTVSYVMLGCYKLTHRMKYFVTAFTEEEELISKDILLDGSPMSNGLIAQTCLHSFSLYYSCISDSFTALPMSLIYSQCLYEFPKMNIDGIHQIHKNTHKAPSSKLEKGFKQYASSYIHKNKGKNIFIL